MSKEIEEIKHLSKHSKNEKIISYKDQIVHNKCNFLNDEKQYILYLYFGLAATSLFNNVDDNTTYDLYFGKTINKNKKILNNTREFNLIGKVNNFFNSSLDNNNNYIYNINDNRRNYLFIFFGTGSPRFYDKTLEIDEYIYVDKTLYKPRYNELISILSKIRAFLESNKYEKIILCGHSNGIVVATFLAYILLILSVDDNILQTLPKHHNVGKFITNINNYILENNKVYNQDTKELSGKISSEILNFKLLRNVIQNKIYICGTGGYPILWTKVEEFNIFNNFYKYKYIHIISAFHKYNMQIYDTMAYYNKFQYIYEKVHNVLSDTTIIDKKPEIQKLYNLKNINYTYYNFGSIIFNLVNHNKINCFLIDNIFDKLKNIDIYNTKTNINYVDVHLDKHHSFNFYRILYNKYMNIQ